MQAPWSDKEPDTRLVGIGEVFCRIWAKGLLKLVGDRAITACGNHNLCSGLPAGKERAVHAVKKVWDRPKMETQGPPPMDITEKLPPSKK